MDRNFWVYLEGQFSDFIFGFGVKLFYAAIAIIIGLVLIKLIKKIIRSIMERNKTELSLRSFVMSLTSFALYGILVFVVGLVVGIKAASFLAIFGAIGLAVGLALQGSLSNFAGGLLILLFKPFKIGDEVIVNGIEGEVADIDILYTRLSDWRGEVYTLPNGNVANSAVRNNSAEANRRIEIELHFSHDEDFDQLKEIITSEMKAHPDVLQNKPFQFWLSSFQPYYIKTSARCWCKSPEYWDVYWGINERLKKAFNQNDIKLAIPKQEVRQPDLKKEVEMYN